MLKLNYLNSSFIQLDSSWQAILLNHCKEDLIAIDQTLSTIGKSAVIYPAKEQIFNAMVTTPFDKVKVVILGQDPYHGEGEANGLAFAVNSGIKLPPSLRNILVELGVEFNRDVGNQDGSLLTQWAQQGVLLLNNSLTVVKDQANSLAHIGWNNVTNKIIQQINDQLSNVVFILWGNFAKQKIKLIDSTQHLILTSAHPSPLSSYRGFFGCNHFIQANQYLAKYTTEINWLP